MSDSVQIPQYISPAALMREGYETGDIMRKGERVKRLQNLSSQYMTSAGTLPTEFLQAAAKEGLGNEGAEIYLNNLKANSSTAAAIAQDAESLEGLGRNPDAGREWRKNPQNESDIVSSPRKSSDNSWLNAPASEFVKGPGSSMTGTPTIQSTTPASETRTPSVSEPSTEPGVMALGEGTIYGKAPEKPVETFTLPPDNEPPYTYTKQEPREYSAVEEMLRRSGTNPLAINPQTTDNGPVFDYAQLSKSSGGVQLKVGIDNALRKLGKEPGQTSVDELLSYAASSVPTPRKHFKDGRFDLEATLADRNEYAAKVTKAKQDMIEKLASGNTTAIGETLAQAGNVRSEEQQKYDLAGQKSEIFTRPVSKDEAARVRVLNETVDDVIGAKTIGGFEGDYQAAVAKAKADGSVNRDAILANLIAMGTVPSSKSVFVKSIMDANGNISLDLWNQAKAKFGEEFVTDPKKRDAWYKGTIDNMNQSIARNGGKARDNGPTPPPEKAGDIRKEKPAELKKRLEAEKKAKSVVRKEGDTWSDSKYNYRMKNGQIQRKAK